MRVLAPYVNLDPKAAVALGRHIPESELILAYTGESDYSYWETLLKYWDGTQDLVIVEQDIEIHRMVRDRFQTCHHHWCTFWYAGPPFEDAKAARLENCLGCVRFTPRVQNATRKKLLDMPPQQWDMVDRMIIKTVESCGFLYHCHGQVRHHHRYEVTWLPSPSLIHRRYTWRHVDKNEYPNMVPRPEAPEDADSFIIDCSRLDHEAI